MRSLFIFIMVVPGSRNAKCEAPRQPTPDWYGMHCDDIKFRMDMLCAAELASVWQPLQSFYTAFYVRNDGLPILAIESA